MRLALIHREPVVSRWLQGRHVSRGDIHRQEQNVREEMIRAGVAPPSTTRSYLEAQYGRWSEFAHHRRRHMLTQVAVPVRIMVTGPHPDWRSRAAMVDHYGWYLAELVSVGGSALGRLLGSSWFNERFQPTFRALLELKSRIPLDEIARGEGASQESSPAEDS
jgi:hypothetical protein